MSANPHNANLNNLRPADGESSVQKVGLRSSSSHAPASTSYPPGHEALQALLAFSSLHEQIRHRRARQTRGEQQDPADIWELEPFVLDEVLQLVAERALTLTGADGVAIALAEENAIVCRASAGTIAPESGARLDPESGFSGACLRTGGIVRCDDSETDRRVNLQVCRRLGTRSIVAVPITSSRGVIGLLEAFSAEAYGFNDSDVRSLNLLAELILAALKPEEENRLAEISQRVVSEKLNQTSSTAVKEQKALYPPHPTRLTRPAPMRLKCDAGTGRVSGTQTDSSDPLHSACARRDRGRRVVENPPSCVIARAGFCAAAGTIVSCAAGRRYSRRSRVRPGKRRRTVVARRQGSSAATGHRHLARFFRQFQHGDYRHTGGSAIRGSPPWGSGADLY